MKFLYDIFPVVIFFVVFKLFDIYVATMAAIVATMLQVGLHYAKHRKVEAMHIVTLVLITVFGGATIVLQNELFIKWKPTILYALFAAAFAISHFVGERTVVERIMGQNIRLPKPVWSRLNVAWSIFFLALGGLNLYVAYSFSTDIWVNFKLFGMTGLMVAFVIVQAFFLSKYLEPEGAEEDVVRDPRE